MTLLRTFLPPSLLLSAFALGTPLAYAQDASLAEARKLELAQKADEEEEGKKKGRRDSDEERGRKGKSRDETPNRERKREDARQDRQPEKRKTSEPKEREAPARQDVIERKHQEPPQPRENMLPRRQDEERARRDDARQRRDAEQSREKAGKDQQLRELEARDRKQKQEAERARQEAEKQKADAARREAEKLKQIEGQKARENAERQKQEAERQRLEAERARQDAARKKPEAERGNIGRERYSREPQREADRERKDRRDRGKFDRSRADQEFQRARKEAEQKGGKGPAEVFRPQAAKRFEELRKGRKTREVGSREIITEPDKRVIVRDEKRTFIRHDESARLTRKGREVRRERRKDGLWTVVTAGLAGAMIYSLMDDDGRVVRRSRRDRDGRDYVLFDDRRHYHGRGRGSDYRPIYIDLPPPVVRIPRHHYIVDYERASFDDIYDALNAPPIERLDRSYSLDEVRYNYRILERMRRVDLDAINFAFGSWEVGEDQYPKLERMARAIHRVLDRSPSELFLIEGHTDAVGDEIDNLSLSDRRAEMVAAILSDTFDIPPENLTTQGYGEEYLKELTDGPSRINRRVAVRRITPLLSRDGWDDPT
ncbi:OmpA family protein [Hyphomicrobium sp. CS1GBMeth3]|uniref:OmpA family protein n=1 Tax=Hyphomicrobium sp. CS1GBMeth3 TaxID=1892845 RepID=UPI000931B898|nr:OmpA family protein [Hyphomicrobium sp. CS1GBMeth3]